MAVSKRMKTRLDKIEQLLASGYSLEKYKYFGSFEVPIPILKDPKGKKVNTLFGGPIGFSWAGFFFQAAFYVQLWEYSYFLLMFVLYFSMFELASGLASAGLLTSPQAAQVMAAFISLAFFLSFGSSYPYIRYLNAGKASTGLNIWFSLVIGFILEKCVTQAALFLSVGKISGFFKLFIPGS